MPRFADVHGQEAAHALLRRAAAKDRLPHAFLFHGVKGSGKTTTAFALAQFLNCEAPSEADACGRCAPCRRIDAFGHPDVHWIFPMAGSLKGDKRHKHIRDTIAERTSGGIHVLGYAGAASIGIGRDEDARAGSVGELRSQAGYAPVEARVKVFVVTEAERMHHEAANSVLKVLEEPPEQNLLVLTAQRPNELLTTIVSRCQTVRFRDLSEEEIQSLLVERARLVDGETEGRKKKETRPPTPEEAALAAALGRGSLTRAAALVQEDVTALRDQALAFLGLPTGDPRVHEAVQDLAGRKDRSLIERLLDFGLLWQGDLLRALSGSALPLANRDREGDARAEAARTSLEEIRRRTRALEDARRAMAGNVYLPLVLYNLNQALAGEPAASFPPA